METSIKVILVWIFILNCCRSGPSSDNDETKGFENAPIISVVQSTINLSIYTQARNNNLAFTYESYKCLSVTVLPFYPSKFSFW